MGETATRVSGTAEQEDNLDFCLTLAEKAHCHFWEPDNLAWLDLIEREHDNVRAALAWALDRNHQTAALMLGGALAPFWCVRGYLNEGRSWLERVLEISDDVQGLPRARALYGLGVLAHMQADHSADALAFSESVARYRELDEETLLSPALTGLGDALRARGRIDQAVTRYEEGTTRAGHENLLRRTLGLMGQGRIAMGRGHGHQAEEIFNRSIELTTSWGEKHLQAWARMNCGRLALQEGRLHAARTRYQEAISMGQQYGMRVVVARGIDELAVALADVPSPETAARLFGASERLKIEAGTSISQERRSLHDQALLKVQAVLGEGRFAALRAEGYRMPALSAVNLALAPEEGPGPSDVSVCHVVGCSDGDVPLTPRELQVATLVARGLRNREIAQELTIASRTVAAHIENSLAKLGLHSRTQLATWLLSAGAAATADR